MSHIDIRPAREDDVPVIRDFIRDLARYEKLESEAVATEEDLRNTLFGAHPSAEILIGELAGEPVGFALFFHNYSTFLGRSGLYLEDLFVKEDCRGSGMGKALLKRLAAIAMERGCGRFEWSVLDWNAPAIGFYESLGAVANAGWTVYRLSGDSLKDLAERKG